MDPVHICGKPSNERSLKYRLVSEPRLTPTNALGVVGYAVHTGLMTLAAGCLGLRWPRRVANACVANGNHLGSLMNVKKNLLSNMAAGTNDWEELRKLARKLENELDSKLVSFSKLGTSFGSRDHKHESSDKVPLLNNSNSDHVFEIMSKEIEVSLEKLTDVNNKMADFLDLQGKGTPTSGLSHILQRHRDILQDYNHDFRKTKSNIQSLLEREDLLGSAQGGRRSSSGLTRRSDLYMKENEHIRNSDRLIDEQISIALETREHLLNQKAVFKAIQTKVNTLATRFPLINGLVQRINLRKRRDSIILGLVIGICIILLLLYVWH